MTTTEKPVGIPYPNYVQVERFRKYYRALLMVWGGYGYECDFDSVEYTDTLWGARYQARKLLKRAKKRKKAVKFMVFAK